MFQTRMVPSSSPVYSCVPAGLMLMVLMGAGCALLMVETTSPLSTEIALMVRSELAVYTTVQQQVELRGRAATVVLVVEENKQVPSRLNTSERTASS